MLTWLNSKRSEDFLQASQPTKKIKPNNNAQEIDPLQNTLQWREKIKDYHTPKQGTYKIIQQKKIAGADQSKWGSKFQAIFINIDWQKTKFDQFEKLVLDESLMDNGIIFIWGPNAYLGYLFKMLADKNFQYVENLTMVQLDKEKLLDIPLKKKITLHSFFSIKKTQQKKKEWEDRKIQNVKQIFLNKETEYIKSCHKTLYMFRRHNKNQSLELRHQRTSDAFFTFNQGDEFDYKSVSCIYQMIETLLPKALYQKKNEPLKMLQLYSKQAQPRKGWVSIVEKGQNNSDTESIK